MGTGPGANHYWRERLPSYAGKLEETETGISKGLLGEVRGHRAGRTPGILGHCGPAGSKS
jgi:hypothetical protein